MVRELKHDRLSERRRQALRAVLEKHHLRPVHLARKAGVSANGIYNFLAKRSGFLSQETYEKMLKVLPNTSLEELTGVSKPVVIPPAEFRAVQVTVVARAGIMQPSFHIPAAEQVEIPLPVSPEALAAGAFGLRVEAPGAELLYPAGSILVCMPFQQFEGELTTGRRVVLQRLKDRKVEVTVREVEISPDGSAWLWPRSSHPEHQAPVGFEMPYAGGQWRRSDDRFSIPAVIIGAYIPSP